MFEAPKLKLWERTNQQYVFWNYKYEIQNNSISQIEMLKWNKQRVRKFNIELQFQV